MNVNLRHWTGTILVAAVAGFVIFGLLRGQEILNDFLKPEPATDANLKKGELLVLIPSLALTPSNPPKAVLQSRNLTGLTPPSKLSPSPKLTSKPTLKPSPSLIPTLTPFPTPIPFLAPTFSPTLTPLYQSTTTASPTPSQTPSSSPTPTSTSMPSPTLSPTSQSGQVVINEIAWMGTAADATDEWIELYNPNSFAVDITGWTIKSFKIKNGVLTADTPDITFQEKTIGAFGYFLLERTADTTVADIVADLIYTGGLDNSGEILELTDNTGQLLDKVGHLTESGQVIIWYAGQNASKSTMERINPANPGNDPLNWQTNNGITKNGLDAKGNQINGTPKAKNSI